MSKEFSNRLSNALQVRNIKASELADIADIPKSAISQYLSGKFEPKQQGIMKIAKALNISEAWLMGADVPMERLYQSKTNTIPLVNDFKNNLQYSLEHFFNSNLPFLEFIDKPETYFALKIIKDDSMAPLLDIDDIAIIHMQSNFENGQTYLLEFNNETMIRKIYSLENNLELHAMNPYYPVIAVKKEELIKNGFKIYGLVIKAENKSAFK